MKLIGLFFSLVFCQIAFAEDCFKKQGAIDIGSGTTKAIVAIVDTCQKKINEIIFEENLPVSYSEAFEKSADKKIPEAFVHQQMPLYRQLAERMRKSGAVSISALATSVFRKATNGAQVIALIGETIDGPAEVISQEKEAELGYWSALAVRPAKKNENIIVWDIGGGSMQMIWRAGEKFEIYEGQLAAVSFKNKVIKDLLKKDPREVSSPNPIGKQWNAAVQLSKSYAAQDVSAKFRNNKLTWIGVGGVLKNSIGEQIGNKKFYTAQDLRKVLSRKSLLTDAQLGGPYASTDVTNLALVAGYMESLKIKKVEPLKVMLTQGWLLSRLDSQKP